MSSHVLAPTVALARFGTAPVWHPGGWPHPLAAVLAGSPAAGMLADTRPPFRVLLSQT
jgi:hypothetical protein